MHPTPQPTTTWRRRTSPLRQYVETETFGAIVLIGAALVALIWANVDTHSYEAVWSTHLDIRVGDAGVSLSLHEWVNSGLMTFFFFIVGLEARRELDLGELRERRRIMVPLVVGVGMMLLPVLIYLAVNSGAATAGATNTAHHAWGIAMSTDTALALGVLALVGRGLPAAVRIFVLTMSVVDDFVALAVIGGYYSGSVHLPYLLAGFGVFGVILIVRAVKVRVGLIYLILGVACWFTVLESGVDPIVVGLAMGLITYAYPAPRERLERASDLFRQFREQPTPELARSARLGVATAISPNDRLQELYHPWVAYLIVPIFALANAGVPLTGGSLGHAFTSPIGLGVLIGLAVGKPLGAMIFSSAMRWASRGRLVPPVGWAGILASGSVSAAGFTVSLLIAGIALEGQQRQAATIGILASVPAAAALTWLTVRLTERLPKPAKIRALYGTANGMTDLVVPVDPERDHLRGPLEAPVTVVEYGDFECPHCGRAEPAVRELLADFGDVRYVWRHLPLTDVHPHAQIAAEATEAAAAQGAFWEMHDLLFAHQDALRARDLVGYAAQLGLDVEQFQRDLEERAGASRVAADVESADLASVSGTPTFFVNGLRHYGAYDLEALTAAVRTARARAYT